MRKGFFNQDKISNQKLIIVRQFKCHGSIFSEDGSRIEIISRATHTMAAVAKLEKNLERQVHLRKNQRLDCCVHWSSQFNPGYDDKRNQTARLLIGRVEVLRRVKRFLYCCCSQINPDSG